MTDSPSYSSKIQQKALWLFKGECEFKIGATSVDVIPTQKLPEVAFVGRSNVGKSSLLNALTNRKALARVSHTPGRTRQLNFFSIRDEIMLVDLPGYGYAKASKTDIAGWNQLIKDYLIGRPNLRRVCMLIDSRHGLKDSDKAIMELLDEVAVCYQIVLTKADKTKKSAINDEVKKIHAIMEKHPALYPEVFVTSSREKDGMDILRCELTTLTEH